ncbi:MAG: lysostaphin resistance A-like protein [Pirellulales bacterium]
MSDADLSTPPGESLPTLAEYDEPPPRRIGWPVVAWLVILALTALIAWGQASRGKPRDGDAEPKPTSDAQSFVFDLQTRYIIGAVNSGLPIKDSERRQFFDQLQGMTGGGNRLRLVVAAGEIVGPQQALAEIDELPDELRDTPDVQTLERLYKSYAAAPEAQSKPEAERNDAEQVAVESLSAPPISQQEREKLVDRLGWFASLALAPPGTQDKLARTEALAPAQRTFGLVIGGLGLGCVAALLGFVMLIALLVFAAQGNLRGLQTGSPYGGVYAETFAAWMALFLGLSFLGRYLKDYLPLPATLLVTFAGSLLAIGWPLLRGVPWGTLRRDIGWIGGRAGIGEPFVGIGCYLMGIPILMVGLVATIIIVKLSGAGAEAGPPLPSHPLVEMVAHGNWLWRVLLLIDAAVLAPIIEETMFRGVLYRHLREASGRWARWLSVLASATVTSFLFAIIHPQGWMAVPALMALAYTFSIAREWRESLIPCMVAHGVQNGLVFAVLMSVM